MNEQQDSVIENLTKHYEDTCTEQPRIMKSSCHGGGGSTQPRIMESSSHGGGGSTTSKATGSSDLPDNQTTVD